MRRTSLITIQYLNERNPVKRFCGRYPITPKQIDDLIILAEDYRFSSGQRIYWSRLCDYFEGLTEKRINPRQMKYMVKVILNHRKLEREIKKLKSFSGNYKDLVIQRA